MQVLIVGITGIAGSYIARHLIHSGATVYGLARTAPADPLPNVQYLAADLTQPNTLLQHSATLAHCTHVVYAGFTTQPGATWDEITALNTALFDNLLSFCSSHLPKLERVLLMQGQKYYGSHLGPFRTPSREDDPRHAGNNFYFTQQDSLVALAQQQNCSWAALRPHIVCGLNTRAVMNPLLLIGAYASLCKARAEPLSFPGAPRAYDTLYQATDADLLGRAGVWALQSPNTHNQAYNITNGDLYRWRHIWQLLAAKFELPLAEPVSRELASFAQDNAALWRELAGQQNLALKEITDLGDWNFANYIINCDWDIAASTVKARLHGFADCRDSLEMWSSRIDELQANRLLPQFN